MEPNDNLNPKDIEHALKTANEITSVMMAQRSADSLDDVPNLKQWIESNDTSIDVIEKLADEQQMRALCQEFSQAGLHNNSERLRAELSALRRKSTIRKRLLTASTVAAASVVLILALNQFMPDDKNKTKSSNGQSELSANVPMLISDNGAVVALLSSDQISVNGRVIANNNNNQLSYSNTATDTVINNSVILPEKCRYTILLADGSTVLLNSKSSLKYPSNFKGANRKVSLQGEAFFKVAKSNKPFIVEVNGVEVRVFGTEFNIQGYDRKQIETTLVSGSVSVAFHDKEILLTPDQRITVNFQNAAYAVEKGVNTQKYAMWAKGFFHSDCEPVKHILSDIGNWYSLKFEYKNRSAEQININATINCNLSIEETLEMLSVSSGIKFEKMEGGYMVR